MTMDIHAAVDWLRHWGKRRHKVRKLKPVLRFSPTPIRRQFSEHPVYPPTPPMYPHPLLRNINRQFLTSPSMSSLSDCEQDSSSLQDNTVLPLSGCHRNEAHTGSHGWDHDDPVGGPTEPIHLPGDFWAEKDDTTEEEGSPAVLRYDPPVPFSLKKSRSFGSM